MTYPHYRQLMGAVATQGALAGGSVFAFQFPIETGATIDPAAVTHAIVNGGWAYDVTTTIPTGATTPYVRVDGTATASWPNGGDFASQLVSALQMAGIPINGAAAQLAFQPYVPATATGTETGFFDSIATSFGVSKNTAQLVVLGGGAFLLFMMFGRKK